MKKNYERNPKILNEFLKYLKTMNYSLESIRKYSSNLLMFFKFYKEYSKIDADVAMFNEIILSCVKKSDVLAYLTYLSQHLDNSPKTRQFKLTCIRSFYKWLFSRYPLFQNKVNPTKDIPNIERVVRLPKYLNLEQSKKIVKIFTLENSIYPLRNNTIIFMFLNTGLRVSELVGLNIKDVNLKNKYIRIIGKGNKERIVYINEATKKQLLKYFSFRFKGKNVNSNEPLFVNHMHKRLGSDGIGDICKQAYKLMGLEEYGYTTHTLRHTFAVLIYHYVKSDILLIKDVLGHESISSTEVYTHVFNEKTKQAIDNNPLNNLEKVA